MSDPERKKPFMQTCRCMLIALVLTASIPMAEAAPSAWKDMIPRPKQIAVTGEQWVVAERKSLLATIVVPPRQPKSTIGAEEINQRLGELGGPVLPVLESDDPTALVALNLPIVISTSYDSALAEAIIAECGVAITRNDPGEQGYVIRFLRFRGRPLILLAGSDPQGALYAAVTMRWLLERKGDRLLATVATVRDWPDFKWRGTGSLHQMTGSLPVAALKGEACIDAVKRQVDWMLRAKLNLLGDYVYGKEDVVQFEGEVNWMRALNAYARDRGIIGEEYQSINVGYDKRDAGDSRFARMMHTGNRFFTWSDDELIRKRAREIGQMYDRCNLGMVVLHCPDGGGPINPEMWNNRSEADRARWGNDRAAADAHLFTLFHEEIKRINPSIQVVFVIYPYDARYLYFDMLKLRYPNLTREQFEWAGREYFRALGLKLPKDAAICVWMGEPQYMDEFRSYFGNRPMYYWYLWSSGWVNAGWLVSTFRYIGTNFYNNPGDIMAVRIDRNFPNYINRLLASQFAWDTRSEGAEVFSGSYYDFLADNDGPEVVVQQWGQRACRHMWGEKLGPVIHRALNQGIIPGLIVNPSQIIAEENSNRRFAGREPLELTPEMMMKQAEGGAAATRALDSVLKMDVLMDDLQERLFVYYLQRTHCLAAYARAHYHLLLAQEGVAAGDAEKVASNVTAGIHAIENGLADMARVLTITATMRGYDPKYTRRAAEGVFPAIPGTEADFPRLRKSLEACKLRLRDTQIQFGPISHKGRIRVAIYDPSSDGGSAIGHRGWMLTLKTAEDMEVQFIDDLTLSKLVTCEVLLYPQSTAGRSVGRYEYFEALRRYVEEAGGGVMFGHHQVGHERAQFGMETTFPEIGRGAITRTDTHQVVVAGEHPITRGLAPGTTYKHLYYDHFTLQPGRRGKVILQDPSGAAVMVVGAQGKGRVIYDGEIILSDRDADVTAQGAEREVFLNAVRWLARRR